MATIKVPAEGWNQLEAPQQEQIREALRSSNLLHEGDDIAADTGLKMADRSQKLAAGNSANNACTTACDIAQAAAEKACSLLPWPASTVCSYAAEAAGDACRSIC
ncbi:MAG: hypothetical protein JWP58_4502 [Hymenobacter sp.]|nr:hypothetical protein [Hymenobacter sp.]